MGTERKGGVSRREVLASMALLGGVTTTAGCASVKDAVWSQPGATDVIIVNAAESSKTVAVTITESDSDKPHTDRTVTIAAGMEVDPLNRSKLPLNTEYTVDVRVEGGPAETFHWDDPTVELAPLWIRVDDSRNITFLLQAG